VTNNKISPAHSLREWFAFGWKSIFICTACSFQRAEEMLETQITPPIHCVSTTL
jgi:hypothetical protein